MPNRLASETSPYLLQHQDNPVDWWPWCDEAIALARAEDKPILLSIGYSACHWCHVMAHESFEDASIAGLMNEAFVNVKVDREERPDLDQIYQTAVQALRDGHGGWPLTVFLTPELTPFWGGTYFPNVPRYGMPSFPQVLGSIREAWQHHRDDLLADGQALTRIVAQATRPPEATGQVPDLGQLHGLARRMLGAIDGAHGGFGERPKFPNASNLSFMLRVGVACEDADLERAVALTLDRMAAGGLYDHLGGGFHRYSVDERWLVPHFEKMLYDNAALVGLYAEGWQALGHDRWAQVVAETVGYVVREMQAPQGGLYATQDADSEGEEGRFFVWSRDEVTRVLEAAGLGERVAGLFEAVYDVTPAGNFEGHNILHLERSVAHAAADAGFPAVEAEELLARARQALFEAREQRVKPGRDEKILTAWNGLMIGAMARAALAFDRDDWREAARRAGRFAVDTLSEASGACHRFWKDGRLGTDGDLDDHAFLADGLVRLYEATGESEWLERAERIAERMIATFHDATNDAWFFTPPARAHVVARLHSSYDGSTPSGASVATQVLLRLGVLCGNETWRAMAERTLARYAPTFNRNPLGFGHMLGAALLHARPPRELVVAGTADTRRPLVRVAGRAFAPDLILVQLTATGDGAPSLAPGLTAGRRLTSAASCAWLCEAYTCRTPTEDPEVLAMQLDVRP